MENLCIVKAVSGINERVFILDCLSSGQTNGDAPAATASECSPKAKERPADRQEDVSSPREHCEEKEVQQVPESVSSASWKIEPATRRK